MILFTYKAKKINYIGMTSRKFKYRLKGRIKDIKYNKHLTALSITLNQNHNFDKDFKYYSQYFALLRLYNEKIIGNFN